MPDTVLYTGQTAYGQYMVVDMVYSGRPARVLFSGERSAAQSGVPSDGNPQLLFDYNQRLFEFVTSLNPKRLLLIGGGVYTLPMALLQALPAIRIDVVEIDAELDAIAETYFDLRPSPRLHIYHEDGRNFLNRITQSYDLVIIDAFTHTAIPRSLMTLEAIELMYQRLTPHGLVAANIISAYYGSQTEIIRSQLAAYQKCFTRVSVHPANTVDSLWFVLNLILIGARHSTQPTYDIRYEPLLHIQTSERDILHDAV